MSAASPRRSPSASSRDERDRFLAREGPQGKCAAAPGRSRVEQFGPRQREENERCVLAPAGDVVDEVEERRLGPVDVLEHDEQRPLACQRFEQATDGELRVAARRRRRRRRDRPDEEFRDPGRVLVALQRLADRADEICVAERVGEHVAQRLVGRPLPVRHAAAGQRATRRGRARRPAPLQAGSSRCRARRRDEVAAGAGRERLPRRELQLLELRLPADERRVEPQRQRPRALDQPEQPGMPRSRPRRRPGGAASARAGSRPARTTPSRAGRP